MGKIHRLSSRSPTRSPLAKSSNVRRPWIKELVENAIDAGARRIAITVEMGGKRLLRVDDDGEGMEPEDARLAVERHATSKITRADDLAGIATLGFRGEALPSDRVGLALHAADARARRASGTEIRINGGAVASVDEVGMPEGTRSTSATCSTTCRRAGSS